jgi:hypothetical protein
MQGGGGIEGRGPEDAGQLLCCIVSLVRRSGSYGYIVLTLKTGLQGANRNVSYWDPLLSPVNTPNAPTCVI